MPSVSSPNINRNMKDKQRECIMKNSHRFFVFMSLLMLLSACASRSSDWELTFSDHDDSSQYAQIIRQSYDIQLWNCFLTEMTKMMPDASLCHILPIDPTTIILIKYRTVQLQSEYSQAIEALLTRPYTTDLNTIKTTE